MVTLTNLTGPCSRVRSSLPFTCPSNPDSATFEECSGRQRCWYTPHALSKALESRAEKQLVEWPTAEEKSPQPAKATLATPTQPLWVLTSVSGSSTLLWRWVRWTRPGPGTMLSDSALQSLQGLRTKGTQMVLASRGAVRTSVAIWVPGCFVHILPEREAIKLPLIPPPWASRLFLHLQGTRNLFASILLFTTHSAILRILSHCVQSKRSAFIHSLIHSFNTS